MSDILTPEAIIQAERARVKEFEVPEWGGAVCIRPLPTAVMIQLEDLSGNGDGKVALTKIVAEYGNRVLRFGLCDQKGVPMLKTDKSVERFLGEVSIVPVSNVISQIMELTADVAGVQEDDAATPEEALVRD